MALLLAAAQAVEADDSENDNLTIQEEDENEDGVKYHKKEEAKLRDELAEMKTEIDDKGILMSQAFNDLSDLLTKYNARLSTREDLLHIRECEKRWEQEADQGATDTMQSELLEKERLLSKYEHDLKKTKLLLSQTQNELERKISLVTQKEGELTSLQNDLRALHSELVRTQGQLSLKDTLQEKLQSQMQEETAKYKKEINRLQTALYLKKTGLSGHSSEQVSQQMTFESAMDTAPTLTTAVAPARNRQNDVNIQSMAVEAPQLEDQTIRIKQEPVDPDEQILIQNNQTQQVTLLNNTPVVPAVSKVVPVSVRTTSSNPSSMVTVYVQSTPNLPQTGIQPKKVHVAKPGLPVVSTKFPVEPDPNQKFVCGRCGKRFIEWLQLQKHLETHSGSRPYKCKFCDKTFRQKYVLDTHIRTHTGERPYKCEQCFLSFGQKATLLNHMRTHTGEKPYNCDNCDKSFAQLSSLSAHSRTHDKEGSLFTCEHCGSILADKTGYLRHLRTVHKINTIDELKPVHLLAVGGQGSPLPFPASPGQDLSNDGDETE